MKVAYCSDLHLEFGKIKLENTENADLLILAGDIAVARHVGFNMTRYEMTRNGGLNGVLFDFFRNVSEQFPQVIYVVGNHEHYSYDFNRTVNTLKDNLKVFPNITLLDKESLTLDGVTFVGGTMWTDMNNEDPLTMWHVGQRMNDFREISDSSKMVYRRVPLYKLNEGSEGPKYARDERGYYIEIGMKMKEEPSTFSVESSVEEHKKFLQYLEIICENNKNGQIVVVSHHTPSHQSIHPVYAHDFLMNGAYHSKLDEFILDRPQITNWFHGHTHNAFDYEIGGCRVACNPRGYHNYEKLADTFKLKYMEL